MFSQHDIQIAEMRRIEAQFQARVARLAVSNQQSNERTAGRRITGWVGRRLVAWGTWLEGRSRGWESGQQPLYNGAK